MGSSIWGNRSNLGKGPAEKAREVAC